MKKAIKEAYRKFYPGIKFRSLFGSDDIVNEDDSFRFDGHNGIFVKGKEEYRLIYDDGTWADILN